MKNKKRLINLLPLAVGIILATFLAGCKGGEKEEEPEVSVQAALVQKADIARTVNAEAVIWPIAQAVITPKVNSPVRKFYVVRGQKVRSGQLLAELESRDLTAAKMDNQGAYEQAQAAYATSMGATLPEDIQKANLDVQTAQKGLDAAQKLYSSRETLFQQGALPRKDLDQAAVGLAQAQAQYDEAKKHLDSLNAIVKQQTVKSATGQLTSARGKYMAAEAQLSYTQLRSPINGVVTDRPLYPGEMASSSAPLVTVMDISSIVAKAHVPQSDALLLRKGDKATVKASGLEDVTGIVTVVSPALDPNSTTVEIWVQAKNANAQLRPGVTAQLTITTQTVHDALVVPASSLLNLSGNKAQVMVIDPKSKAEARDVEVGIQAQQGVQIVSGVNEGEQVVTEGAYGLPDKTKVKVENPAKAEGDEAKDKDKDKEKGKDKDKDKDKEKPDAGKKE
ncbi:MAG TPA: efflux RND transporter periplasmic adaptor subunit [Candidatus Angelobacter sp.]